MTPPFGASGSATIMPYSSAVCAQLPADCRSDAFCTHPWSEIISARPEGRAAAVVGVYRRTDIPAIVSVVHVPVPPVEPPPDPPPPFVQPGRVSNPGGQVIA